MNNQYLVFQLVLLRILQRNVIFGQASFALPILQKYEPNLFKATSHTKSERMTVLLTSPPWSHHFHKLPVIQNLAPLDSPKKIKFSTTYLPSSLTLILLQGDDCNQHNESIKCELPPYYSTLQLRKSHLHEPNHTKLDPHFTISKDQSERKRCRNSMAWAPVISPISLAGLKIKTDDLP